MSPVEERLGRADHGVSRTPGRGLGWFLLGVAGWNVVTWLMFARNLYDAHAGGEDRPTGYWVAHTGLIVVNLALAVVFAVLGTRALRR